MNASFSLPLWRFAAVVFLLGNTAMAQLPSDKYEQPRHTVFERAENIEIRDYAPMLVAEVELEGEREAALSHGFRILAGYIFGGNVKRASIAMTSPVTQDASEKIAMTSPVTQTAGEGGGKWRVAFMLPKSYTIDTVPQPNDGRIKFRLTQPERRVAIRFSGISSESNLGKHKQALEAFLNERKLAPRAPPVLALYDDPFTLPWNRRNEWWVAIASDAQ
jgi:hypothetical protein